MDVAKGLQLRLFRVLFDSNGYELRDRFKDPLINLLLRFGRGCQLSLQNH